MGQSMGQSQKSLSHSVPLSHKQIVKNFLLMRISENWYQKIKKCSLLYLKL